MSTPRRRIVNGQLVDADAPVSAPRQVSNTGWSIINVVALFFKTLANPEAEKKAIEEQTRRTGSMPNPWEQQQRRRTENRLRGRPLGNVRNTDSLESVQHRGGAGG
eukprot:97202_1